MNIKKMLLLCFIMTAAKTFAQQIDMTMIPFREGDKWGYVTPDKSIIITPKYNEVNWFSEGYASVKIGNKYGYINKAGKLVIPAKFTVAKSFRKGYMPDAKNNGGDTVLFAGASLVADGYEICINIKGDRMPKCPAIAENQALENHVPLETIVKQKTYTLANNNGLFDKVVDDYKIDGSDETYYIAIKNDNYGVFNSKFETIVPFEYSSIKSLRNRRGAYLKVVKNGMYGIIDPNGQVAISPENSNLSIVDAKDGNEYVIVQKNGKTYVKDLKNNNIISTGYSDIAYDDAGGFIITGDNNMKGYYFMDNTTIQPKYKDVKQMNGGKYLMVKTAGDKMGYINSTGTEYFVE